MPAAAPDASRILRSDGDTGSAWPTSDPREPPVTMIGPSAPKGAPVPIAIAAEIGFAIAVQNLLWGAGQPFSGALADRFGVWRVMWCSLRIGRS